MYMHDEVLLDEAAIMKTGRCIADDRYSWGFSALLLLTFCCYTFLFALALILLQTDVYWNSRHDRDHQSHSIYTDVLYLAEELKNAFGQNIEDHLRSPKAFDKMVKDWKQALSLDVRELPLSRWQEWRQFRAAKRSSRKANIAPPNSDDPSLELRKLGPRKLKRSAVSDTAYHGLIGGDGAESNFESVSRSDHRSTSEEQASSLASMQTRTEADVRDGTVLDPVTESFFLEAMCLEVLFADDGVRRIDFQG